MIWHFENTGYHSGAFNMEYDERLARMLVEGSEIGTVRIYGWKPAAISLGWNQSLEEIDLATCSQAGIDVVRRPTGGRAILHSDELTYSVTMVSARSSVLSMYNEISKALVCGLRHLNVDVSLEKSQPHFPSLYRTPSSAACFTSSARYEISVGGRKLVGSAQRRYARSNGEEVMLQHGSILLGGDHKRMVEFLAIKEKERLLIVQELNEKTTDLCSVLQRTVTFEELVPMIRLGFEEAWGIRFAQSVEQSSMIGELA
ncbi:MAG: lipoate--protein ligase family protein [Ignavibacteriales bacterium]|nr:lipoate--protein ligase family protein [Ignavibacteriales bacterium]